MAFQQTRNSREVQALMEGRRTFKSTDQYDTIRNTLKQQELDLAFDRAIIQNETESERKAQGMLKLIQANDIATVYDTAFYPGSAVPRRIAEPYLENLDLINRTRVLGILKDMPKAAHLHIHYNACLPPDFLITQAALNDNMYIWSDTPLLNQTNQDACQIQFKVIPHPDVLYDLFSPIFDGVAGHWMKYSTFLRGYPGGQKAAEAWLASKVVFTEAQVYGIRQTVDGVWDQFGKNTRFLKGLFGYEDAFRVYTRALIDHFVDDGISYAELRPTFPANIMSTNDGSGSITNHDLCQIIIDEVQAVKSGLVSGERFEGVKIIYCAPKLCKGLVNMAANLAECLALKLAFPNLICGFDLVGPEELLCPINHYVKELLDFKADCKAAKVEIPFMFHAGETILSGTNVDDNLFDALLLGSKRIGHGFALAQHPYLMKVFREQDICLEVCPIGNELLHLTPSIRSHAMYTLLANNVPCTVNSDNAAFYSSTLSHDFYQTLIGSTNMSLLGLKQLLQWSIDHSCLNRREMAAMQAGFDTEWTNFIEGFVNDPVNAAEFDAWDAVDQ